METLVLVAHVIAGLTIVGLVLLQHGKGADVGAAFGSGSAGSGWIPARSMRQGSSSTQSEGQPLTAPPWRTLTTSTCPVSFV